MRRSFLWLPLPGILALALAACQPMANVRTEPTPAASQAVIHGSATYLERIALPPGSSLQVQLVDTRLADTPAAVIAQQTYGNLQGPPFAFDLSYDASRIRADAEGYALHASLYDANHALMFVTDTSVPVRPGSNQPVSFRMVRATDAATLGANANGASPWDAARARGVGFRAVGNEPGWNVEVDKGAAPPMRATLDYGQRQLQVAHTQPFSDPASGTVGFRGNTDDGTRVELTIHRGQCQDDMSGESFDASAELAVGAQRYKGCGRFLFQ
jgi:uncharacterized lipoprotein YbaY